MGWQKQKKIIEIKKIAKERKIWDNEKEASKIKRESKEVSTKMIPQVDQGFWEKSEWEDTNEEDMKPYD